MVTKERNRTHGDFILRYCYRCRGDLQIVSEGVGDHREHDVRCVNCGRRWPLQIRNEAGQD